MANKGKRNRSGRNFNRKQGSNINKAQSRQLSHIHGQTAQPSRLPSDPPPFRRMIGHDLILDWNVTSAGTTVPQTPTSPGRLAIATGKSSATITVLDIVRGVVGRYGFPSTAYDSWLAGIDGVAIVRAAFWGPVTQDVVATPFESITLGFNQTSGDAVGRGQSTTVTDQCGRMTRARCALSPPMLHWWVPRTTAVASAQPLWLSLGMTEGPSFTGIVNVGYVRITVRLRFAVPSVDDFIVGLPIEPMDQMSLERSGEEDMSSEQRSTMRRNRVGGRNIMPNLTMGQLDQAAKAVGGFANLAGKIG